ncbi:MAG: DUF6436 domain-containing protein [Spongiibacteraceae bacterium]
MLISPHPIPAVPMAPAEGGLNRSLWSGAVLLVWLITMAVLFWHFEGRFFKTTGNHPLVHFAPDSLPAAPAGDIVQVMYFLAGDCPCERVVPRQIEALHNRYGVRLKQWVAVGPDAKTTGFPADVAVFGAAESARWRNQVPAFPAVAVWDAQGLLVYFGPPAAGSDCGAGESYVTASLVRIFDRRPPLAIVNDVTGCLCSAPERAAD